MVAILSATIATLPPLCAARADETSTTERTPPGNAPQETDAPRTLTGDSTLADWQKATAAERSRVAVALAKNRLAPTATRLEIATAAMEITGCISATARDARFAAWKVAPTAATCLAAPEKKLK